MQLTAGARAALTAPPLSVRRQEDTTTPKPAARPPATYWATTTYVGEAVGTDERLLRRYSIPLASGRTALALVRSGGTKKYRIALGYFFGPFEAGVPTAVLPLKATDATAVRQFTSEGIMEQRWVLLASEPLDSAAWPNPVFGSPGAGYRRTVDDVDPGKMVAITGAQPGDERLPRDGLAGSLFMEGWLDEMASNPPSPGFLLLDAALSGGPDPELASEEAEQQCVILEVPDGDDSLTEEIDQVLEDRFQDSETDEYDGYERDPQMIHFFLYGASAQALSDTVARHLAGLALPAGTVLRVRPGQPGTEETERRLA